MKYIQDLVKTLQGGTNTNGVFLGLLTLVTVIAAVAHLIFIFLFDSAGVAWMARANVASVLVYALSAMLIQNGRHMLAMALIVGEILLHGILAVVVIGWESGFHYYIILIIPVAILSNFHQTWFKAVVVTAIGVLYMVLDFIFRQATPLDAVPETMLQGLHYFNQASTLVILAMLATAYYRLVANAEARLRHQACTDPLTQLQNRRFAMEVAQHEAAVFERGGRPLALVLGDVDHFKRINDVHGHETGDTALKAVAQALREGVREIDHVARWGGEEFLMLLPSTDEAEALAVSERLRQAIEQIDLVHQHQLVPISITLGVSLLAKGETIEQALARADQALYKGKTAGRNRVILAGHGS
ncbi:MAG: GGDEF domain-containing protein [Aquabacterium sp.]|nr:GGDEF domain-containing protein [Aquabacterium sp.]